MYSPSSYFRVPPGSRTYPELVVDLLPGHLFHLDDLVTIPQEVLDELVLGREPGHNEGLILTFAQTSLDTEERQHC